MNYTDILVFIRKIVRSVNIESKRIQKEYDISIPQLLVLNYLAEQPNLQSTHAHIAKFLNLNPSTATGILQRMEKKGWIARLPHAKDKRAAIIAITVKGSELQRQTPALMHEQISARLEDLSEARMRELRRAFETIIEFLDIEDLDASPIVTAMADLGTDSEF